MSGNGGSTFGHGRRFGIIKIRELRCNVGASYLNVRDTIQISCTEIKQGTDIVTFVYKQILDGWCKRMLFRSKLFKLLKSSLLSCGR